MTPSLDALDAVLREQGLSPHHAWLRECIASQERAGVNFWDLSVAKQAEICFGQFLFSDMNLTCRATLPPNVEQMHKSVLTGRRIMQVDEVADIGTAAKERYTERNATITRCLKLSLTDGVQRVFAIEYRPISALHVFLTAGTKVAVTDVPVRRGLLLLVPEIVDVLGGGVEDLEAARKRAVERWNQPPCGRRNAGGHPEPSLADAALAAAWGQAGGGGNEAGPRNRDQVRQDRDGADPRSAPEARQAQDGAGLGSAREARQGRDGPGQRPVPQVWDDRGASDVRTGPSHTGGGVSGAGRPIGGGNGVPGPAQTSGLGEFRFSASQASGLTSQRSSMRQPQPSSAGQSSQPWVQSAPAWRASGSGSSAATSVRVETRGAWEASQVPLATTQPSSGSGRWQQQQQQQTTSIRGGQCTSGAAAAGPSAPPSSTAAAVPPREDNSFTYLLELRRKAMGQSVRWPITARVKCVIVGVKRFDFKDRDDYYMEVHIEDGSALITALVDHQVVQCVVGCGPRSVVQKLSSRDTHEALAAKAALKKLQMLFAKFEGLLDVVINGYNETPKITGMSEGVTQAEAQSMLRRSYINF